MKKALLESSGMRDHAKVVSKMSKDRTKVFKRNQAQITSIGLNKCRELLLRISIKIKIT